MQLLPVVRKIGGSNAHPHTIVTEIIAWVMVDDRHYDYLSQFRWNMTHDGYPVRKVGERMIYLHKEIWELEWGHAAEQLDHKDENKLNAQLNNLRTATNSGNGANKKLLKHSTTGLKGVTQVSAGSFRTQVYFQRRRVYQRNFTSKIEAAEAYDEMALKFHGEFAKTNKALGLI